LAEFLKKHGSEVFNMMSAEFRMEEALRVRFEEGKEDGEKSAAETVVEMIKAGASQNDIMNYFLKFLQPRTTK
jgi:hypothetical protein